jgi:hypothetical protein
MNLGLESPQAQEPQTSVDPLQSSLRVGLPPLAVKMGGRGEKVMTDKSPPALRRGEVRRCACHSDDRPAPPRAFAAMTAGQALEDYDQVVAVVKDFSGGTWPDENTEADHRRLAKAPRSHVHALTATSARSRLKKPRRDLFSCPPETPRKKSPGAFSHGSTYGCLLRRALSRTQAPT